MYSRTEKRKAFVPQLYLKLEMRKKAETGMHSVHMNIVALHSYILVILTLVSGLYFEDQRLIFLNILTICHLVYV
jgi:hypothetical protein